MSQSNRVFRVYPREKLAIVQWLGRATFQDVVDWIDEVGAHPDFASDFDGIVDLRAADLTGMAPMEVNAIARLMIERQLTHGTWVHLATGPMETALSMIYSRAIGEQYRMRVFSTIESAAEYLQRDPAELQRFL